jgi:hypothetical protein
MVRLLSFAAGLLALALSAPSQDAFIELDDIVKYDQRLVLHGNPLQPTCPPTTWVWEITDPRGRNEYQSATAARTDALFHEFANDGSYLVRVTIRDACGNTYNGARRLPITRRTLNAITLLPEDTPFSYTLHCQAAAHGPPGEHIVWRVTRQDARGPPVLDLTPRGEPSESHTFTFPGPGAYEIACTALNTNDKFRPDYWNDPAFAPCNNPNGCVTSTASETLIIPAPGEHWTDSDGGRNPGVRGTTKVGPYQFTDHCDGYGHHAEYFCTTQGDLLSETRDDARCRNAPVGGRLPAEPW